MPLVKKITRETINHNYYQENKEKLKEKRRAKWKQAREITKQEQVKQLHRYYRAASIKVLLSLKDYTELTAKKKRLWVDFGWTLTDCQQGLGDIVAVMKLREVADQLIHDYWATAKQEISQGKSWNSISEEKQQRLIKYWGQEKARIENHFLTTAEQLERQSQAYCKDIELAKFHEERGKVKCVCWSCAEIKQLQSKIKSRII